MLLREILATNRIKTHAITVRHKWQVDHIALYNDFCQPNRISCLLKALCARTDYLVRKLNTVFPFWFDRETAIRIDALALAFQSLIFTGFHGTFFEL